MQRSTNNRKPDPCKVTDPATGEEFTRGAYGASWSIGGLSRWGHLQNRPVGPIFFASSDIQGIGYMHVDGGVRIGTDTANRINSALLAPVNG
ncbi:Possible putrescine oxidase [Mycobacteroides abscessus subsp. abscessus]|nr:Possible putrescine oxidase [Mycobacteroides abscessus subsp. abscessus]